jgi:hypothetical protein
MVSAGWSGVANKQAAQAALADAEPWCFTMRSVQILRTRSTAAESVVERPANNGGNSDVYRYLSSRGGGRASTVVSYGGETDI